MLSFIFKNKLGVTYTEVLLIVAIIAILGTSLVPFSSNFVGNISARNINNFLNASLRKAQFYAINNKNNETWGVCLINNNIRLYSQSCASPSYSEDYGVPSSVSITGFSDIQFSALRGEPNISTSIQVAAAVSTFTININTAGGVGY